MNLSEKQNNRLKFRTKSFYLVFLTMIIGAILAFLGKSEGFAAIAAGVMTFAGLVFGSDYFSKVETD